MFCKLTGVNLEQFWTGKSQSQVNTRIINIINLFFKFLRQASKTKCVCFAYPETEMLIYCFPYVVKYPSTQNTHPSVTFRPISQIAKVCVLAYSQVETYR